MKRLQKIILACASCITAAIAACAADAEVVYETGFDTPEGVKGWNWKNHTMWKVEDGEGVGGGRALVWTNSDPKAQDTCWMEIPGARPGVSYRAEFKIKVHSHSGGTVEGTICWLDGSKWLGGAGGCEVRFDSGKIKPDAEGWMHMAVSTTPYLPAAATSAKMQLYVKRGGVGRIAFDDVKIYVVGERLVGSVNGLVTSRYRATAADGDVKFAVTFEVPREYWNNGRTGAELSYLGVDGSRKTVAMQVPDTFHAETTLPVAGFAMGRNPVCATVKGSDGKVFGERTIEFERVKEMPERRVWIDRFNRTIVDGKPFFPIGMFWSIGTLEKATNALERYATGPFNCLQNYDHTLGPKELDRFWAKGLRVIVGVKDVFAPVWPNVPCRGKGRRGSPKRGTVLNTWADEDCYLSNLATSLKDHPALLGWYVCDEFPVEMKDRLRDHYELLKRVDPGHLMCGSILHEKGAAGMFIDCLDVFWVDSYSIASYYNKGEVTKPDFGEAWIAADGVVEARDGCFGMLRCWGVGQAFAHKWDHPQRYYPNRELLRFPTFRELKSQCWQIIATGANGMMFYSYSQLLNSPESEEKKEEYYRRTCDVAAEIRRMIPVLTLEPGPKVASMPSRVRVRTWRDGDVAYALVCNSHPEPRKGAVRIEGDWRLGKVVFGKGIVFSDDALALDMPSLGVAIVRLEK